MRLFAAIAIGMIPALPNLVLRVYADCFRKLSVENSLNNDESLTQLKDVTGIVRVY